MTKRFLLLISLTFVISGCVEKNRLDKYDTAHFDTKKLEVLQEVNFPPANDQSMDNDPNLFSTSEDMPTELSIEKCRQLALENNLELKVSLIEPKVAKEDLKSAHAAFEPLFVSGFNFVKNDYPQDYDETERISTYGNINVPLVTGGELSFYMPFSRTEKEGQEYYFNDPVTGETTLIQQNSIYDTDFSMGFSQPLLRGGGISVNTHYIRQASYNAKSKLAQAKLQAMWILYSIDKAYWSLYAAQEALKVRQLEYDLAKAQYEQAQRMVNAGQLKEIEVIRAESAMAERLSGIIKADNSLRNSQRDLKLIINSPDIGLASDFVYTTETEPVPVKYNVDQDQMLQYALDQRVELLQIELSLASSDSEIEYQKNSLLPYLGLEYTYNINGLGSNSRATLDQLDDNRFKDHSLGFTLRVPLGNQVAKSSYRKAILQRQILETNKQLQVRTITQEVLNAVDALESNWNTIVATQKSADLALRTLEAEQRQFKLGLQTSTEVLDAQTRYANALLTRLQALVQYQVSQIDLCAAIGGLNQAAQISFE